MPRFDVGVAQMGRCHPRRKATRHRRVRCDRSETPSEDADSVWVSLRTIRLFKRRDTAPPLVDLETLLRTSRFIVLAPLTSETTHLINADTLAWVQSDAYLVNVARGPVVQESALIDALTNHPPRRRSVGCLRGENLFNTTARSVASERRAGCSMGPTRERVWNGPTTLPSVPS